MTCSREMAATRHGGGGYCRISGSSVYTRAGENR